MKLLVKAREGLVKKVITDSLGRKNTVWVNPNKKKKERTGPSMAERNALSWRNYLDFSNEGRKHGRGIVSHMVEHSASDINIEDLEKKTKLKDLPKPKNNTYPETNPLTQRLLEGLDEGKFSINMLKKWLPPSKVWLKL